MKSARTWVARLLPVVTAAIILGSQVLAPPVVGLADNGDYLNLTMPFQFAPDQDPAEERFFSYLVQRWKISPEVTPQYRLLSSALLLEYPAAYVARKVAGQIFDLRWTGLCYCLVFLWALYLLSPYFERRWWLALLLIFVFCDVGYFSVFNSFYMDAASFVFLLLAVAFYVRLGDGKWYAAGLGLALLLFLSSKLQHTYLIAVVVPFLFLDPQIRAHMKLAWRIALTTILIGAFLLLTKFVPDDYLAFAGYNVLFSYILPNSPDPVRVLVELKLPPEMQNLSGTNAFEPRSGLRNPYWRNQLLERDLHTAVATYYLYHPGTAWQLIVKALAESTLERPIGVSNFARDAGRAPGEMSQSFAQWSDLKKAMFGGRASLYAAFLLGAIAAAWLLARRRAPQYAPGILALAVMAGIEFAISSLADCADTTRHLFLFRAILDVVFAGAVVLIAAAVSGARLPVRTTLGA